MEKIVSWILVSTLAAPLLFGCETSNRNYSQTGRVIDVTAQNNNPENQRPLSLAEQSLSQQNATTNQQISGSQSYPNYGNNAGTSYGNSQAIPNGAPTVGRPASDLTVPVGQNGIVGNSNLDDLHASRVDPNDRNHSGLIETPLTEPALPDMSGINSQFSDATASNNNLYSNATIPGNAAQQVSRPAYNQNVTIPSSVAVPQSQTTSNRVVSQSPAQQVSMPKNEDLSQKSTSSGNWLLVDSSAAQQDESNTAARQEALQNSTAVSYQASQTTTAGPDQYRVVKGDTLYSIAFRYGLDYHTLADINKIEPPYNLAVGQVLTLKLKASAPKAYVVQKGDTLYSIAKKNNQSVAVLASVNNLEPPYNVIVGQKLYLSREEAAGASKANAADKGNMEVPVAGQQVAANNKQPTSNQQSKPTTSTSKPAASTSTTAQTPIINSKTRKVSGVTWSWPTSGRVVEQFSTAEQGNKGLDIEGKRGQAIFSAADGQVVYSGNALRGFGNLVIINHSNEFLSAYAHNDALLVKEGQKVKRGQQIARMGNTDASSVRLHFEIRYRGQSVNPINYLPK